MLPLPCRPDGIGLKRKKPTPRLLSNSGHSSPRVDNPIGSRLTLPPSFKALAALAHGSGVAGTGQGERGVCSRGCARPIFFGEIETIEPFAPSLFLRKDFRASPGKVCR